MLATRPNIDTIAITRTFDGIEAATHRIISQVGGMASVIKDAKIAVLKPNFLAGRSAESCQLVGIKPRAIPHLKLALEQVGKPSWTLVGEEVGVIKQFRLPEQKALYRFVFWLMYPLDYPYSWIAERGRHFCTTLYSTGLVGTRPQINEASCTRCGVCVEACPLPAVIDLKTLKVNPKTCQRCLLCYEACPENAISVKGYSGVRKRS